MKHITKANLFKHSFPWAKTLVRSRVPPGLTIIDRHTPVPGQENDLVPDIGIQFLECLSLDAVGVIVDIIIGLTDADADIRFECVNGRQNIVAWMDQTASVADNEARKQTLQNLDILDGFTAAFSISQRLISISANNDWAMQPLTLNNNGDPDPGGNIHLTGFDYSLVPNNQIVTTVTGHAKILVTTADFSVTITDTMATDGTMITTMTQSAIHINLTELYLLNAFAPILNIIFVGEIVEASKAKAPSGITDGIGYSIAKVFPQVVLIPKNAIPGASKILFNYGEFDVDSNQVIAKAFVELAQRSAAITLSGPTSLGIPLEQGHPYGPYPYSPVTTDLRTPITFAWTVDGGPVPGNPTSSSVLIPFPVIGRKPNTWFTKTIKVTASDPDGFSASACIAVSIYVLEKPLPTQLPGRQPIKVKPE